MYGSTKASSTDHVPLTAVTRICAYTVSNGSASAELTRLVGAHASVPVKLATLRMPVRLPVRPWKITWICKLPPVVPCAKARIAGSSRLMQNPGLVALAPAGSVSECEPAPFTSHGSLPRPTDAPPDNVHPVEPFSKPLF